MVFGFEVPQCHCPVQEIVEPPPVLSKIIAGVALAFAIGSHLSTVRWFLIQPVNIKAFLLTIKGVILPRTVMEKRLAQMVEEKRFEMTQALADAFFLSQFAFVMTLMVAVAAYFGLFPNETLYLVYYCVVLTICAISFSVFFFKKHMTIQKANVVVYSIFVIVGIPPAFASTQEGYYFTIFWARALQLLISIVGPDLRHFVPVNLLHLAWEMWIIFANPGLHSALAQNLVIAFVTTGYKILMRIAATAVFRQMGTALISAVQAAHSEGNVRSLLAVLCDVLVPLREDLTLSEDSPRLAALLCTSPALIGLKGQPFSSLLAATDVARFEAFVRRRPEERGPARQITVYLQNDAGRHFPVQMYHHCLKDPVSHELFHFLGLVEDKHAVLHEPGAAWRNDTANAHSSEFPEVLTESSLTLNSREIEDVRSEDPGTVASGISAYTVPVGPSSWEVPGQPATLTVRTWLNFEVLEESEGSQALFCFSQDAAEMQKCLSRFSKPHMFLRWLEFAHTMAVLRYDNPNKTFFDGVLKDPANRRHCKAAVHLNVLSQPVPFPEEGLEDPLGVDFDPASRFVTMKLDITALQRRQNEASLQRLRCLRHKMEL